MDEIRTLQQKMDTLPDDTVVHIGAHASFFFIGNKAEYEADIDDVSDELLANMERELATLRTREENAPAYFKKNYKNLLKKLAGIDPSDEDLTEKLEQAASLARGLQNATTRLIQTHRRIPVLEQNIEAFKPVRERSIMDFYPCLNPEDGVNIIVGGPEVGRYWTLDEYRSGVVIKAEGDEEDEEDEE